MGCLPLLNSVNPGKPRVVTCREREMLFSRALQDCLMLKEINCCWGARPVKGQWGSTKVSSSFGEMFTHQHIHASLLTEQFSISEPCRALLFLWLFIFYFLPFVLSENHGHWWLPIFSLCLFETCLWLGLGLCFQLPVNSKASGFHKKRFCLFT